MQLVICLITLLRIDGGREWRQHLATNTATVPDRSIPTICGLNSGKHIYLDCSGTVQFNRYLELWIKIRDQCGDKFCTMALPLQVRSCLNTTKMIMDRFRDVPKISIELHPRQRFNHTKVSAMSDCRLLGSTTERDWCGDTTLIFLDFYFFAIYTDANEQGSATQLGPG